MQPIYPKEFSLNGGLEVTGIVECVYDTNGSGALVPVGFTQSSPTFIYLVYQPRGKTYIQYKGD